MSRREWALSGCGSRVGGATARGALRFHLLRARAALQVKGSVTRIISAHRWESGLQHGAVTWGGPLGYFRPDRRQKSASEFWAGTC